MEQLYKFTFSLILLCLLTPAFAQIEDPLDLQTQSIKTGEQTYDLIFTVNIDPGWSTYSQDIEGDMGPFPTTFTFENEEGEVVLNEEKSEECGELEKKMDPVFQMEVAKFNEIAVFIKSVEVEEGVESISGFVTMMACDATKCLPPVDHEFTIDLNESIDNPDYDRKKVCAGKSIGALDASEGILDMGSEEDPGFEEPVQWSFSIEKKDDTYRLIAEATIDDGWKIYGPHNYGFEGPFSTTMYFDTLIQAEITGDTTQIQSEYETIAYDPFFQKDNLSTIKKKAKFVQEVKATGKGGLVEGFIEYQSCDSTKCLPPTTVPFVFQLDRLTGFNPEADTKINFETKGEGTPEYAELNYDLAQSSCMDRESEEEEDHQGFFWIFMGGFLGGFIALLTPCVFPMIPLTVSFFTKSSKDRASGIRNALIYGFSIIVIYVLLGLIVTSVFGADALNLLSTNAWFNIFFFLLFVVFALSFFGLFEITLPSSWSNSADRAADRGGLIGIFFMAFTLSLVSFSCTGPIIGTLLVETATGGGPVIFGSVPAGPLVGMLGFSVALALPFALFAAFPSWLNSLPQSGGWMNSVKVLLGFAEIALALKFLSVADLTMGWKILPYELFVALWLLCALGIAFYFFGFIKFPLDYTKPSLSKGRSAVGVIAILLAAYFATGFTYSDRNETFVTPALLSGLAPPAGHSYIFPNECPLNLYCFKDFEKGKAYAQEVNKPILLDFTGHGCVNCRKMEDRVWGEEEVYKLINEKYVLISLYVDERTALEEPYESKFDSKLNTTIGNKWADFQAIHFGRNSQPYYVLMSPEGAILNEPVAYTPDVEKYRTFLQCGIDRYNEMCGNCLTQR